MENINKLLEEEQKQSINEQWNKLSNSLKIQKLHIYAEKYGKNNNLPMVALKQLKIFFTQCIENGKLKKVKDVVYDKETNEIQNVVSLMFNSSTKKFTLKNMDKRVSTLKALTPKCLSSKNKSNGDDKEKIES